MIAAVLGPSAGLWKAAIQEIEAVVPSASWEWKYYGKPWGWSLIASNKKKKLVYLTPAEDFFMASFIFSDAGRAAVRASGLPQVLVTAVEAAKANPQAGTFDLPVAAQGDLETVRQLLAIKVAT